MGKLFFRKKARSTDLGGTGTKRAEEKKKILETKKTARKRNRRFHICGKKL